MQHDTLSICVSENISVRDVMFSLSAARRSSMRIFKRPSLQFIEIRKSIFEGVRMFCRPPTILIDNFFAQRMTA